MKFLKNILITGAAALCLVSPVRADNAPQVLTGLPTVLTGATTNNFFSSVAVTRGYPDGIGNLGTPQSVGIWITSSNNSAYTGNQTYVFTPVQDGTTNTPATAGIGVPATFSCSFAANGTSLARAYYVVSGTNLIGAGGFYCSSIQQTNTATTNYPVSSVVQTSPY